MKNLFTIAGILFSFLSFGQVGINTSTPTSTLEISGSLEGQYRKTTTSTTLTDKDYYLTYEGTAQATLTLPSASPASGPTSFAGRIYKIKNLSTYPIVIQAASGQNLRFGGGTANSSNFTLNGGEFVSITANDTGNTWNLDFLGVPTAPNNGWKLNNTVLGSIINVAQSITTPSQIQVDGGQLAVTVPSGYNQVMIILRWDVWGDVNTTGTGYGSLRFHISQTGTSSRTISSIMMTSWARSLSGNTSPYVRFSAPVAYTISDLTPGTYNFNLLVNREGENSTASINSLQMWGVQAKAEIYVK